MKKYLLCISLSLVLSNAANAADPSTPMADVEPQVTPNVTPSAGKAPVRTQPAPAGVGLEDFAFGIASQTAPGSAPPAGPGGDLMDDEFLAGPQPHPALEGF